MPLLLLKKVNITYQYQPILFKFIDQYQQNPSKVNYYLVGNVPPETYR